MSHGKKSPAPMSRRQMLRSSAIAAGGATILAATLTASAARAQSKMSQEDAEYQDTPKDGERCDGCTLFESPSSCRVVDGDIDPAGWCKLFQPVG
jgi:nitrous oxide reductase